MLLFHHIRALKFWKIEFVEIVTAQYIKTYNRYKTDEIEVLLILDLLSTKPVPILSLVKKQTNFRHGPKKINFLQKSYDVTP